MIICVTVYYSWTETLKLRNMSLAAVSIPEMALYIKLGSCWFRRDDGLELSLLVFISLKVVISYYDNT